MIETIKYRTNQWWQPKAGFILSAVYLSILLHEVSFYDAVCHFLPAVVTILGIGLFGYISNDFFDRKHDLIAQKKNMLHNKFSFEIFLLTTTSLLLAFLPWLILPYTEISFYLLIAEFALLLLYAIPPFRLKERGFIALIADALYAYLIPFLLAFYTFSLLGIPIQYNLLIYIPLFFWLLLVGVYNLAIHQIEDFENDIKTNTPTWAVKVGKFATLSFVKKYVWTFKMLSFAIFSISLCFYNLFLGLIFLVVVFVKLFSVFKNNSVSLHDKNSNVLYLQSINFHYHLWMPYIILIILIFKNWTFSSLLALHVILFNHSYLKILFQKIIKSPISFVVNHGIYYIRRLFGQSEKQAMREFYGDYLKNQQDIFLQCSRINILLANSNKAKYTETFVANHFKHLSEEFYVHYFYGGVKPNAEAKRGRILSNFSWIRRYYYFIEDFLEMGADYFENNSFKEYLIKNNISLVLAEFGTVGLEIYEFCKEANVPIVVVFYGYDAHHIHFSPKTDKRYLGLFEYASAIVCVSKDILNTLKKNGAPCHKLIYLPCAIDLSKFPYTNHSKNPPVFLSVGRFAETKSPHLTILAFNEVLKAIPEARLRMIGKDGGGELFEACHILVKALKIEDKVEFLGILEPEKVYEEMENARVFVQHSLTTPINQDKEGTPVSVMEALASGLPVVATNHAGIAELITSGENGILVDEYDYLGMAVEMIRVCESDELVERLGKAGAKSISENDLIKENTKILNGIIENLRAF